MSTAGSPSNAPVPVPFFVTWAHLDRLDRLRLIDLLDPHLLSSPRYRFQPWQDVRKILAGERWRDEVDDALETATFGLVPISPAFLASSECARELKVHLAADKPLITCLLADVHDEHHNNVLAAYHTYGLEYAPGRAPVGAGNAVRRSFASLRSRQDKARYAKELYIHISRRLDRVLRFTP